MAMKFFQGIKTLAELKLRYRKLAAQHHPDAGGSDDTMKELNAERDTMVRKLMRGESSESIEAEMKSDWMTEGITDLGHEAMKHEGGISNFIGKTVGGLTDQLKDESKFKQMLDENGNVSFTNVMKFVSGELFGKQLTDENKKLEQKTPAKDHEQDNSDDHNDQNRA